jgi:hypothetical protein
LATSLWLEVAAGRLKELKRVERSLYSVRAGRGSRSLVGGVELDAGATYLRSLSVEYWVTSADGKNRRRISCVLFVIKVNGGLSERIQSREKVSILL